VVPAPTTRRRLLGFDGDRVTSAGRRCRSVRFMSNSFDAHDLHVVSSAASSPVRRALELHTHASPVRPAGTLVITVRATASSARRRTTRSAPANTTSIPSSSHSSTLETGATHRAITEYAPAPPFPASSDGPSDVSHLLAAPKRLRGAANVLFIVIDDMGLVTSAVTAVRSPRRISTRWRKPVCDTATCTRRPFARRHARASSPVVTTLESLGCLTNGSTGYPARRLHPVDNGYLSRSSCRTANNSMPSASGTTPEEQMTPPVRTIAGRSGAASNVLRFSRRRHESILSELVRDNSQTEPKRRPRKATPDAGPLEKAKAMIADAKQVARRTSVLHVLRPGGCTHRHHVPRMATGTAAVRSRLGRLSQRGVAKQNGKSMPNRVRGGRSNSAQTIGESANIPLPGSVGILADRRIC